MRQIFVIFFLLYFQLLSTELFSQFTGLNLSIRSKLEHLVDEEKIHVVAHSTSPNFSDSLRKNNIEFERFFTGYFRLLVGKKDLEFLKNSELIDFTEIDHGKGFTLNDSMLSNNNIVSLHKGVDGSRKKYSGKDVILGFIDTGIDFSHPDFQDSTGKTRVMKIWDQKADTLVSGRIPSFGYGQVYDSSDINNSNCPHDDDVLSHGTNVAGIAAGNGMAIGKLEGVATESDIIFVATDFNASDWLNIVADAVEYIFSEADNASRPCVINISAGNYLGSHDGTDLAAKRIDSMLQARSGRSIVAAAGNSGSLKYHLGYNVNSDTNFTWFQYNASSSLGYGAVYFQLWSDTSDFNQVDFSIGANKNAPSFQFRGSTPFDNIKNRLNIIKSDSLIVGSNLLGVVRTYAQLVEDKYLIEVNIAQPDSNQYLYSFISTGSGRFDVWSDSWLGHSHIFYGPLPNVSQLPSIQFYKKPDSLQTIVSSFTCLPSVITVGNYINRNSYVDVNNQVQNFPVTVGEKALNSSLGPNRRAYLKPDVMASGDFTLTANRLASIPLHIANNQANRIAQGGKHKRNGGTSMAAPVVAGIAALMLEECASLSAAQIKSSIIQHSRLDSMTGSSPNYSYGNGKVDALSSVKSLYYQSEITPGNDTVICGDNSILFSGPPSMNWYSWSTGDSSQTLLVDSALEFSLIMADSNLCVSIADTISVSWSEAANKPVITRILDTLIASSGNAYQWYLDNQILTGNTSQKLLATSNGSYTVEVWNQNQCSAVSDPVFVALGMLEGQNEKGISIGPNPVTNGKFRVYCDKEIINYKIYNSELKLLRTAQSKGVHNIEVSGFLPGFYFLRIENEEKSEVFKLMIN